MNARNDPNRDELMNYADEVFGDRRKSDLWLNTPHDALDGQTPLAAMHTESGRRNVEGMLSQLDEGIYT
jgi:uncharacterized protein (DUF2384 family)